MRFLSGLQNEGVVFGQRERVGNEIVDLRMAEANGRLHLAWRLLLAQDVGDVVCLSRPPYLES